MNYKWLLFDLDNTLFDFNKAERFAFKSVLKKYNLDFSEERFDLYHNISKSCWQSLERGEITQDELRTLRMHRFLEAIEIEESARDFGEHYLSYLSSVVYYMEHAEDLVLRLKDDYNIVCITNGIKDVQRRRLAKSELTPHFHSIVISDEIGVAKPDKAYFDHTFEKMNFPNKEEVLVIGDNIHSDILGGINYGLRTCWYNPYNIELKDNIQPDFEITELNELYTILSQ